MIPVWNNLNYWIGIILLCFMAAGQAPAKTINHTPDVTSDAYWDSHHIDVVHVTVAGADADGAALITYQVENSMSEAAVEPMRTVPVAHLWLGSDDSPPVQIAVNDRLILYYAKEGPSAIVATLLDNGPAARTLVALRQISKLRQSRGDYRAYMASLYTGDATVTRYVLRHLLEQSALPANADDVAGILRLSSDQSQEPRVRVLASQLANRLKGGGDYSDADYSWLRASLAGAKTQRWEELATMVNRLLNFEAQRSETAAFLAQLALNPKSPMPVRIAAYGAFEDPRLFNFGAPDAESERIFETCAQMLKDREPAIRGAGAALLHNISTRVNSADAASYIERARIAITDTLSAENDEGARHQMGSYLDMIGK